ncbi:methyltransferase-like protein 6 [Fistulifera solaris]|uniref:peptide chain release factor N(5)-glutamine methyltransferase n=1 Tax=Fistulifera solaris TaxID=1519565 RepID=A0A1Z5KRN8_FISSO|nr:methyltransferase-like protein 6 [Fistulifera solaris]|eukprot:GAX28939.1 methyltransferase-like protein 6 [Fistulifera solaris]
MQSTLRKRNSRLIGLLFWSGGLIRSRQLPLLTSGFSSTNFRQVSFHRQRWTRFLSKGSCCRPSSTSLKVTHDGGVYPSGISVALVLEQAIHDLKDVEDEQAMMSVTNILADILDLPWTTGYKDLASIATNQHAVPQHLTELACRLITAQEAEELTDKLHRRKRQEPIQHIIGKWDFLDYNFLVRAPLLCPRPETEELVELVAQEISDNPSIQHILDVGCGTGCIGISLATKFPYLQVSAIDLEPVAVQTSQENARLILGSQWKEQYDARLCTAQDLMVDRRFDLVASNPPYIPSADMNKLDKEVKDYESHQALSGLSEDGLDVIREIIAKLPYWCNVSATCWMEVDPSQPAILRELLASHPHVAFVSSHYDMFGKERFVKLQVHHVRNH